LTDKERVNFKIRSNQRGGKTKADEVLDESASCMKKIAAKIPYGIRQDYV